MNKQQRDLNDTLLWAVKVGCLTPTRYPKRDAPVSEFVKWGAKKSLQKAILAFKKAHP